MMSNSLVSLNDYRREKSLRKPAPSTKSSETKTSYASLISAAMEYFKDAR
jgi:hypothetical protein